MIAKARIGIILIFLTSVPVAMAVYVALSWQLISGAQALALFTLATIAGAISVSLVIEFTITEPLRGFTREVRLHWHDKKALPDPAQLPQELRGMVANFNDVLADSARKLAALGDLQRFDEEKYEFISIANHQLRTPLTEIRWGADELARTLEKNGGAHERELMDAIRDAVGRIVEVTDQFLAVAEFSTTTADRRATVDVGTLVHTKIEKLAGAAKKKQMAVSVSTSKSFIPTVTGDPLLLGFAFETLLANAISYGNAGTPIHVRLGPVNEGAMNLVSVEDTGIPLSSADQSFLFEKFHRGDAARRARPNGSGLALYLTKRIVERHGGTIGVQTTAAGTTVFSIALPISSEGNMQQFVGAY